MPKQIKLGFDRIPVPATDNLEPLYDFTTGNLLQSAEGGNLFTEVVSEVGGFSTASNATPVHINNDLRIPLNIAEQFPETSQVSSSLLGIPRQERQLSLFSDVSTYGLNGTYWEFFRFNGGPGFQPTEWTTRRNPTYGPRYQTQLIEVSNEQALAVVAFPVTYTFPFGKNFEEIGIYDAARFSRYVKFISLGILLFQQYTATGQAAFAKENFLDPEYAYVDGTDVVYSDAFSLIDVFSEIEKWTMAWNKLVRGLLEDPISGEVISIPQEFGDALPGYSSTSPQYGQLQSRKTYRYQPGRSSGFTFGIRVSTDSGSLTNTLEWGCGNETDAYMFQIVGSRFNIVRRSTIPLPEQNLILMGLTKDDQNLTKVQNPLLDTELWETIIPRDKFTGDPLDSTGKSGYLVQFEQVTMWKIEFSWYGAIGVKFYVYTPVGNDDARWILIHRIIIEDSIGAPCLKDPFLRFRYTLYTNNTANITFPQYIYKYGASYYIDGGDEGATTNHSYASNTIISSPLRTKPVIGVRPKNFIKNKQGDEVINQKDIIPASVTVSSEVNAKISVIDCEGCPGYGYYYAPSLRNRVVGYTDNFTVAQNGSTISFASSPANIISISSTPDEFIVTHETNDISTFPVGRYVRIANSDVEGYNGVWKVSSASAGSFTVANSSNPSEIATDVGIVSKVFSREDNNAKLIADGIYSAYIKVSEDGVDSANIARRVADSQINNEIKFPGANFSSTTQVVLANGTRVSVNGQTFSMRLSKYSGIAVGSTPLTRNNININFLNPRTTDSRQFAEFFVGITDLKPYIDEAGELLFRKRESDVGQPLDIESLLYGEYAQYAASKNRDGLDVGESDPRYGDVFEFDPQIPNPRGNDSGYCSQARVVVNQQEFVVSYTNVAPVGNAVGTHFLISENGSLAGLNGLQGGEVGTVTSTLFTGSGVFFEDDKFTLFIENNIAKYYIAIDSPLEGISQISIKFVSLEGRSISKSKVFNYDLFPLYVIVGLRDGARVNNITIDEFDLISQFSYTPVWIRPADSSLIVVNSGSGSQITLPNGQVSYTGAERINPSTGLFESGGTSVPGAPSANFVEQYRLDSAQVDTQLQQPLRPGEIRTSFYVGENETNEFQLNHVYGADRNVLTPGLLNVGASFIVVKSLTGEPEGEVQLNLMTKEQ